MRKLTLHLTDYDVVGITNKDSIVLCSVLNSVVTLHQGRN